MKIKSPFLINAAGLAVTSTMRRWMDTLDCRWSMYDRMVDTAIDDPERRRIYLFWHEYILIPLDRRGRTNVTMLLSRHRDADVLSRIAAHQGFGVVRGSTFDGGTASLRELIQVSRRNHLTITPDGPRGPRRQLALGPIYLASKLGMPIVPMGYGYDRPWRMNSWDRFALPRPYSRARAIWGPEMQIPKRLDRDGLEHYRCEVERMINYLTTDAEAWAESGTTRVEERRFERETARPIASAESDADTVSRPMKRSRSRSAA
ncbi:MAG: lysophospholipid acyltransferase family protein [Planctomycetia bacterium]|nr:lysophospholipid acyltransferase family protein [Planctomycetia bacterium]